MQRYSLKNIEKLFNLNGIRSKFKNIKGLDKIVYILYFISSAFILTYVQEYIFRESFLDASIWIRTNKLIFFINLLIWLMLLIIFSVLLKSLKKAFIIEASIVMIISVINYYKLVFKGEVLDFSDFILVQEATNILGNYKIEIAMPVILGALVLVIWTILIYKIKLPAITWRSRLSIIGIAIVGIVGDIAFIRGDISRIGLRNVTYIPETSYKERGLLFGMIREIKPSIKVPENYTEEIVQEVVNSIDLEPMSNEEVLPNIIMIMNESFYDMTLLDNVIVSDETMPNLKSYQEVFSKANLISPVYGGSTCQTEYEVLTGYSIEKTEGRMGYTELIKEDTESMVSVLNRNNYHTVALHPYERSFFKRAFVYEKMGFDEMFFQDDLENVETAGTYISDKYVYETIISKYEENRVNGKQPFFAHIVTMQNHGGYDYEYDVHGITIANEEWGEKHKRELQTYVNLIREADESLKYLIEYFEGIQEPTIIVFYGDHAPGLNWIYEDGGELTNEEVINNYTTPLLIWDNIENGKNDYGYINAYKLGALVLDIAGIEDSYFKLLNESSILTGVKGIYLDEGKWVSMDEILRMESDSLDKLWLLQYDRMFGKKYSLLGENKGEQEK